MRLKTLSLIISATFIILASCLFWTQLIKGNYYYHLSQNNRIRLVSQEAVRGNIFDVEGKPLADSIFSYDLVISPQELKTKREKKEVFDNLSSVLGTSSLGLEAIYKKNYIAPFADVAIAKDIPKEVVFKIEQMNLELPGVSIKTKPQRRYIYKDATSHILGYLGEIDRDQLTRLTQYGYRRKDLIGKAGVEKSQDIALRGEDGGMQIEVNNRNFQVAVLSSKVPKNGQPVRLTIDIDIQQEAYKQLNQAKGAVVVLNPQDGRIIAMASSPSFDPNVFGGSYSQEAIKALLVDETTPLINRAIHSQYPPGSIFKIITTTAGLETKRISDATTFYCPGFYSLGGRRFSCWEQKGHGRLDLKHAIEHSCNVYFFKAGEKIRQEPLTYYSHIFGLGQKTGIDLRGEVSGFIPDKNWKRYTIGENWYDGDTLNFSIGQGYVLMTPLQAAVMISSIANGGKLVQPYLIESVGNVKVSKPCLRALPVSPKTINILKEALNMAVESPGGTGILARVDGLMVSGKTGTAQLKDQTSHAWFISYAPSENPKAAIVVFLENGGYGGESAAPIAGAILKKMKQLGML